MFLVFLYALTKFTHSDTYSFQELSLTISNISLANLNNPQALPDACGKMLNRNIMLHHINNGYI